MHEPRASATVPLPPSIRLTADEGQLRRLDVASPRATAQVYFHGAHPTAWQPSHAGAPVLWLSERSQFQPDKPIRGGVPVCFPWFGPHRVDEDAPAHGFARLSGWTLTEAAESGDGIVTLAFSLERAHETASAWPHPCRITHHISIGAQLRMALEVHNPGTEAFTFEEALHTYLAVEDVEHVAIAGLEGAEYLDKASGFARLRQGPDPIRFTGETDRLYPDTTETCVVHDPGMRRRIVVRKQGSRSTVIWNPWIEKARAMPDFGDLEWRGMVCVETANVGAAAVRLEPGGTHRMTAEIAVENE